jgi:hypothetical protein
MNDDFYRVLTVVAEAFEELNIAYYIGGSLASITYGMPRSTMDVNVAAEMQRAQVQPFVARVSPLGYIDAESMDEALRAQSSFNFSRNWSSTVIWSPTSPSALMDRCWFQ